MPLIARVQLHGSAGTFGILLGTFGVGAVSGGMVIGRVSRLWSGEAVIRACGVQSGISVLLFAVSRWLPHTALALYLAGLSWTISLTPLNGAVQIPSPRWVTGRTLAIF
jgi:predicted MFS family arabinose efflux permease